MSRAYPETPGLGVGAVVFRDKGVLLIKRGTPPNFGAWIFPGGLVELGEPIQDALVREVQEETGWTVRVGELVKLLDYIERDGSSRVRYHYIIADYLCEYVGGELQAGSDVAEVEVVPIDRLSEYDLSREALEVIELAQKRA
jgi:mutator protein MutT